MMAGVETEARRNAAEGENNDEANCCIFAEKQESQMGNIQDAEAISASGGRVDNGLDREKSC